MADFLLELLSEEIPARMQAKARNELAQLFAECTQAAGLRTGGIDTFSTPRRLVLISREVAEATEASREEVKGPRTSALPQALDGFLRKTGLAREQLEERDGVYFAVVERAGRPAADILAETIRRIVADFPWPKSMRWGDGSLRWVRPLHGIVALLGEEIVPLEIDGIASGATTVGHRFHHPGPITIGSAADYLEKLRACHVIVDQEERERIIREGAQPAASKAGLTLLPDEGLVVENAGLTEWPVPLLGHFDPEFLDVPREVIVLTMRTNQKYFACANDQGLLAPAFVCVANVAANDGGEAIAQGNARVLAARLADARFFWEQDLKVPLEEQAKKLDGIVFHEKLGTVADKVERVAKLARWLIEEGIVAGSNPAPATNNRHSRERGNPAGLEGSGAPASAGVTKEQLANLAERAARLAKADLVSGMVGEFPELQGVIGGYLAEALGQPKEVADAIRDHYKPLGQGDEVPTAPVTVAVALADKLDTIAGFFIIGEQPTGSKDPFAIRRAALGSIALLVRRNLRLHLVSAFLMTFSLYVETSLAWSRRTNAISEDKLPRLQKWTRLRNLATAVGVADGLPPKPEFDLSEFLGLKALMEGLMFPSQEKVYEKLAELLNFLADRLRVQQRGAGVRHDLIDAVYVAASDDDFVRLLARVKALQSFVETKNGADLLTAYKRAANILKKENWTGGVMSSAETQGIPQTGEEDPLVLVDDPIVGDAVAEMASGQTGADLPQEKALIAALNEAEPKASAAIDKEDFTAAMAALASLRRPIDEFFDHVTVNDPDPAKRERRLNFLMRFRDAVNRVADFSKIEG
jgi:glycyl-tRNA synthetase beta chain